MSETIQILRAYSILLWKNPHSFLHIQKYTGVSRVEYRITHRVLSQKIEATSSYCHMCYMKK